MKKSQEKQENGKNHIHRIKRNNNNNKKVITVEVTREIQKTKLNGSGRKLGDSKMKKAVRQQIEKSKKNSERKEIKMN